MSLNRPPAYKAAGLIPVRARAGTREALMIREDRKKVGRRWLMAGGKRDPRDSGESLRTAVREFVEETNLTEDVDAVLDYFRSLCPTDHYFPESKYVLYTVNLPNNIPSWLENIDKDSTGDGGDDGDVKDDGDDINKLLVEFDRKLSLNCTVEIRWIPLHELSKLSYPPHFGKSIVLKVFKESYSSCYYFKKTVT